MMSAGVYHSFSPVPWVPRTLSWPQSLRLKLRARSTSKFCAGAEFRASFIKRCGVLTIFMPSVFALRSSHGSHSP
jgi:hypothetical protein